MNKKYTVKVDDGIYVTDWDIFIKKIGNYWNILAKQKNCVPYYITSMVYYKNARGFFKEVINTNRTFHVDRRFRVLNVD